ncbi:MmgE/PrpD family protein [Caballeronia turbans]|jgi:2-methylcitrate dehydratase PrpD|uniref:MmgE/PrpD family protein n=1 Tax=unclassified Caballeronia TaxID=2646786 RepID=UPI00074CCFC9|nr:MULTISPECIES: MmgE/PrpD family protein [unclassified Caballeronia]SAL33320.1 MmgE/PrpD family protein [Caballeronia turbans]
MMTAALPLLDDASRFTHALRFEMLPDAVVRDAQRRLLDLFGIAAAGTSTRMSSIAREHALDCFAAGRTPARMLFDGRIASAAGAAFAGAATIDSFDGHDGHALTKGHAGVTVLPALLAMTERVPGMSGREFIVQTVLGYELGTRAGIALHATSREYHTSGAWNALAAAAIASRALSFDLTTTRHALGIAEYHGPRSDMMRCIDHPTMLKDGSCWGALAGISAALLASRGFTGAPATTVERDAPAVWADLGERWLILEQYVKPYPVCRWAHPSIAAALAVRAQAGFDAADIKRVEIETFHEAKRLWSGAPRTTEEAQYGVLFPVAAALLHGRVDAGTIGDAGLADPAVRALLPRLVTREHAEFNAAFPAERWARVRIELRDGRRLDSGAMQASGDPARPMTPGAEREKFRTLTGARFGARFASELEAAVDALAEPDTSAAALCELVLNAPTAIGESDARRDDAQAMTS